MPDFIDPYQSNPDFQPFQGFQAPYGVGMIAQQLAMRRMQQQRQTQQGLQGLGQAIARLRQGQAAQAAGGPNGQPPADNPTPVNANDAYRYLQAMNIPATPENLQWFLNGGAEQGSAPQGY